MIHSVSSGKTRHAVVVALVVTTLLTSPAPAHKLDTAVGGKRLGPVRFNQTTLRKAKAWFTAPSQRKTVQLGCIKAVKVTWRARELVVYFTKSKPHLAIEGSISKRAIKSRRHGTLRMHTRLGLNIGDGNRRLRRLYPGKSPSRHANHYDWFLAASPNGGRLVVLTRTRRGPVAALFAGPYETC